MLIDSLGETSLNQFEHQEREVVRLEDILADSCSEPSSIKRDPHTYNWVDARIRASRIFTEYGCEMAWAEDAWNILMFGRPVDSLTVAESDLGDESKADILLWLLSLYSIYWQYKLLIGYEFDDNPDLASFIDGEWCRWLATYPRNEVYTQLNEHLIEQTAPQADFFDVGSGTFVFTEHGEPSVAAEVLLGEIERRADICRRIIRTHFRGKTIRIAGFFGGTHWCENYYGLDEKRMKITRKYEFVLQCVRQGKVVLYRITDEDDYRYSYEDEDEVISDMEDELEEAEREMDQFLSDPHCGPVYDWISAGMRI